MKRIDDSMIAEAKEYVASILTHEISDKCLFHTINHTLDVLKHAETIGSHCKLDADSLNILIMSALFHDVGYVDAYDDHEIYSADRARDYLKSKEVDELVIYQIEVAIHSTKTPQNPIDEIYRCGTWIQPWHMDHIDERIIKLYLPPLKNNIFVWGSLDCT